MLWVCVNGCGYCASGRGHSLQVVATKVGGVPEVLPHHLIYLAEPSVTGQCIT